MSESRKNLESDQSTELDNTRSTSPSESAMSTQSETSPPTSPTRKDSIANAQNIVMFPSSPQSKKSNEISFSSLKPNNTVHSISEFNGIYLSRSGPARNLVTVGTEHIAYKKPDTDISAKLEEIALNSNRKFSIILERPSIQDVNRTSFEETSKLVFSDPTQYDVSKKYDDILKDRGFDIIGADGRKRFIVRPDGELKSDGLTSRSGECTINSAEFDSRINNNLLLPLMAELMDCCLGLESKTTMPEIIAKIGNMVSYRDPTNLQTVLESLHTRVHALAGNFSLDDKLSIKTHLLSHAQQEISQMLSDFKITEEETREYHSRAHPSAEIAEVHLAIALHEMKKSNREDILDCFFKNGVCDLRLYAEILGNPKTDIIVVFGNEHINRLNEFIRARSLELQPQSPRPMSPVDSPTGTPFKKAA